ncbi:hypothetical protein HK413_05095 [Mucilaginibacter sp. S1162]|uniref:Uncharacterized protein n=1 Tax=Mucilaginibacter humi TaxID=2732510 RepID=A0ABX1W0D6_9SPHI|nr:hypothetical protein [Mucilaginibacter humi]NNU33677.1 hypothetical protein [Mucilaginibacter humi]
MKISRLFKIIPIALVVISGCGRQNEQRFTGTYVTSLKDEYGTSDDTLIISVFGSGEGMYQIKRTSVSTGLGTANYCRENTNRRNG